MPDPARFDRHQRLQTTEVSIDRISLYVSQHDAVNQRVDGQHIIMTAEGNELYPVCIRYAWPSELDLMATLAGLSLRERWSGWRREPFTADSTRHVSVYERASTSYL